MSKPPMQVLDWLGIPEKKKPEKLTPWLLAVWKLDPKETGRR